MDVVVTGSTGMIGEAVLRAAAAAGDRARRLVRSRPEPGSGDLAWRPDEREIDARALEGVDAVVHLAGRPIEPRWTERKKAEFWRSRVDTTRFLAETLAGLDRPPAVLVSASAIGVYGIRGDEVLTEAAASGGGFMAELCRAWEDATAPAVDAGLRVCHLRTGLVLDRDDGLLPRLVRPFRLGVGGRVGSGRQWWSWVTLDDAARAVVHLLHAATEGPVNVVAPAPVTNAEFTRTLAAVLHRPAVLPVPRTALRVLFGTEAADEMILASQRVAPTALEASGFDWSWPELGPGLAHILERR